MNLFPFIALILPRKCLYNLCKIKVTKLNIATFLNFAMHCQYSSFRKINRIKSYSLIYKI